MAYPVVCRYKRGKKAVKGVTRDFASGKTEFHVTVTEEGGKTKVVDIDCSKLKAVFFVKDLEGNKKYKEKKTFDQPTAQSKIKVKFHDGEEIVGTTLGYSEGRPGFFVLPADPNSNNQRVYALASAVEEVIFEPNL